MEPGRDSSEPSTLNDVIATGEPQELGVEYSRIRFVTGDPSRRANLLVIDDSAVIETRGWCGTCPFWFRNYGSRTQVSLASVEELLRQGLDRLDERAIQQYAELLPRGRYLPLLLRIAPRRIGSSGKGSYWRKELTDWWSEKASKPEDIPTSPHYRTFEGTMDANTQLFEFVLPLVSPHLNDQDRVKRYAEVLASSDRPTAVALSILTVHEMNREHWILTHFLLDGHHKMQAAAETGRRLRLLSLLAIDESLFARDGSADQLDAFLKARAVTI